VGSGPVTGHSPGSWPQLAGTDGRQENRQAHVRRDETGRAQPAGRTVLRPVLGRGRPYPTTPLRCRWPTRAGRSGTGVSP